jgi:hypothetical protein
MRIGSRIKSSFPRRSGVAGTVAFAGLLSGACRPASGGADGGPAPNGVVAIAAGCEHTCVVLRDGRVECWGDNTSGQCGDQSTPYELTGHVVQGVSAATTVGAGASTCVTVNSGEIFCWGASVLEALGTDGNPSTPWQPSAVVGVHDAVEVNVTGETGCYKNAAGALWCWGQMDFEQCGLAGGGLAPPTMTSFSHVSSFAAGVDVCAVTGGQVECQGQTLCNGMTSGIAPVWLGPNGVVTVSTSTESTALASCAVLSTGAVECWGNNTNGMLGDGTMVSRASPAPVVGISDALGVTVGADHVCAWLKDGSARCWGSNTSNQLGAGLSTQDPSSRPVMVQGLTGVVAMAAGCSHTCAVVQDGSVWCWGDKLPSGQLGVGSNDTVALPARVQL